MTSDRFTGNSQKKKSKFKFQRKIKFYGNQNYIPEDKTDIVHVDEVLKLLSVMTGDNRYESILSNSEGVRNMCEVAERLENIGRAEGRKEGRAEGRKEGREEGRAEGRAEGRKEGRTEDISRMLNNGKTPEEIAYFCGFDLDEILQVQSELN